MVQMEHRDIPNEILYRVYTKVLGVMSAKLTIPKQLEIPETL